MQRQRQSNDPKMIAYLPVMYCVNCTGAEEALMVMGWGVAVAVMGRWGGCGFGFGLHLHASKVEVTVTGSFFVVLLPFFSPSPPATLWLFFGYHRNH